MHEDTPPTCWMYGIRLLGIPTGCSPRSPLGCAPTGLKYLGAASGLGAEFGLGLGPHCASAGGSNAKQLRAQRNSTG
jgi:hypothetical protein